LAWCQVVTFAEMTLSNNIIIIIVNFSLTDHAVTASEVSTAAALTGI